MKRLSSIPLIVLCTALSGLAACSGPQGEQGIQGAVGEKGETGEGFFDWFRNTVGDQDNDGDIDPDDVKRWLGGQPSAPVSLQPGVTYEIISDQLTSGKFYSWDSLEDTTAKFFTSEGDIKITEITKNADSTVSATGGYGKFKDWYGNLSDQSGDGLVFKAGTLNQNGNFDFTVDLADGNFITGELKAM